MQKCPENAKTQSFSKIAKKPKKNRNPLDINQYMTKMVSRLWGISQTGGTVK
jgi:hypothetical protein